MSQKSYEKWLEDPDSLSVGGVESALAWKRDNPAEASALRAQREAALRWSEEKALLKADFIREGGDEKAFEREWPLIREKKEASRLRELDETGRLEAARDFYRSF